MLAKVPRSGCKCLGIAIGQARSHLKSRTTRRGGGIHISPDGFRASALYPTIVATMWISRCRSRFQTKASCQRTGDVAGHSPKWDIDFPAHLPVLRNKVTAADDKIRV